jgi:hypothetical protein
MNVKLKVNRYKPNRWWVFHKEGDLAIGEIYNGKYYSMNNYATLAADLRRIADWLDIIQSGGNPMELT